MPEAPSIPSPAEPALTPAALDSLLEQVTAPNADLDAIAAAHSLTRPGLARILQSPEAQPLLSALRHLYALHRDCQLDHITLALAQTLLDAARAADNPTDKRLAATAILRLLHPPLRARSASEEPAHPRRARAETPRAQTTIKEPTSPSALRRGWPSTARPGEVRPPHPANAPTAQPRRERAAQSAGDTALSPSPAPPTPSPTPHRAGAEAQTHPEPGQDAPPPSLGRAVIPSLPSASHPSRLDRALNRRRPRIESLTTAGAPPDTS